MLTALRVASRLLSVLWPVLVLVAIRLQCLSLLAWFGCLFFGIRALVALRERNSPMRAADLSVCAFAIALCAASIATGLEVPVLWYPVAVNAVFLALFGASLLKGPTVVERLAVLSRRGEPLPIEGVAYTRRVTIVWCCFFVFNGSVAVATVLSGDATLWALWNGCVSYILMGVMALCEYLIRRRVCKS